MAERDYKRGEGVTPIQEMTTRQLRRYIRERAEEANARLDSIKSAKNMDIEDMSRAFQDQLSYVQSFGSGRSGALKKDTSRMSKEQMAEYAYAIRDLNMLDTESKYAKDLDYKENKERYENFIRNKISDSNINAADREYWKKFYNKDTGRVKKAGYTEYKNFINYIKNIDDVIAAYGYETIKDKYYDETDPQTKAAVENLLSEVYFENRGSGMSTGDLVEAFNDRLEDYKKTSVKVSGKTVIKKSKSNIKTKTAGKMKNGVVRDKQATKKL